MKYLQQVADRKLIDRWAKIDFPSKPRLLIAWNDGRLLEWEWHFPGDQRHLKKLPKMGKLWIKKPPFARIFINSNWYFDIVIIIIRQPRPHLLVPSHHPGVLSRSKKNVQNHPYLNLHCRTDRLIDDAKNCHTRGSAVNCCRLEC